jgi:hypothetical protein
MSLERKNGVGGYTWRWAVSVKYGGTRSASLAHGYRGRRNLGMNQQAPMWGYRQLFGFISGMTEARGLDAYGRG